MSGSPRVNGRLVDRVCLVTGGGSGIGRATCLRFAEEGARIAVADIDLDAARETVRLATAVGGRADVALEVPLDVTDPTSCEGAVEQVVHAWQGIDVLFNNAGIAGVGSVEETSLELWERVMAVNVRGVFLVAKAVLPIMVAARRGSIINMSSTIAEIGLARRASYAASKGAVLSLTRQMQADYAQFGIRVNALLPGTIHTPFVDRYLAESYDDPAAGLEVLRRRQLTGELGTPEDVAAAALFLASDESRFVLGSGLFVDGGVRARNDPGGRAVRLLSHLVDDEERLAVAIDDRDALDAVDLLGDGPWTMARLLQDVPANLERLRDGLRGATDGASRPAGRPLGSLQLLPPVRPTKIVAIGRNYHEHAAEESATLPTVPLMFAKFPSALVGSGATITWSAALSEQVDYEAELAVVIGRRARNVAVQQAPDHVLGYSCLNDVSARDLQVSDGQWTRAKSLDTFCPMGPWLVSADEVPDVDALRIRCRVNGEVRQDASTGQLVHGVAELIAYCSSSFTLEPGDVIATGTPGGVGAFREPPVFLEDGDLVEVEIDRIGTLRNRCRVVS